MKTEREIHILARAIEALQVAHAAMVAGHPHETTETIRLAGVSCQLIVTERAAARSEPELGSHRTTLAKPAIVTALGWGDLAPVHPRA